MKYTNIFYIVITCLLFSCVQTPPPLEVTTTVEEPNRIRFSGKGAGAGMMLSGSMGPMGIAIGVAIDEGISKDIDETAKHGLVNLPAIFEQKLQQFLTQQNIAKNKAVTMHISRYGFITQSGDNDPVSAELKATIHIGTKAFQINYPAMITDKSLISTASLDLIKTNAAEIKTLFESSIDLALLTTFNQ